MANNEKSRSTRIMKVQGRFLGTSKTLANELAAEARSGNRSRRKCPRLASHGDWSKGPQGSVRSHGFSSFLICSATAFESGGFYYWSYGSISTLAADGAASGAVLDATISSGSGASFQLQVDKSSEDVNFWDFCTCSPKSTYKCYKCWRHWKKKANRRWNISNLLDRALVAKQVEEVVACPWVWLCLFEHHSRCACCMWWLEFVCFKILGTGTQIQC